PRRVGLPAAASGTAPVELARPEAAIFATIARQAAGVRVDQVAEQLEVAALLRRLRADDLHLEEAVDPEQRRIAPHLVAHQLVGRLVAQGVERLLENGVE